MSFFRVIVLSALFGLTFSQNARATQNLSELLSPKQKQLLYKYAKLEGFSLPLKYPDGFKVSEFKLSASSKSTASKPKMYLNISLVKTNIYEFEKLQDSISLKWNQREAQEIETINIVSTNFKRSGGSGYEDNCKKAVGIWGFNNQQKQLKNLEKIISGKQYSIPVCFKPELRIKHIYSTRFLSDYPMHPVRTSNKQLHDMITYPKDDRRYRPDTLLLGLIAYRFRTQNNGTYPTHFKATGNIVQPSDLELILGSVTQIRVP